MQALIEIRSEADGCFVQIEPGDVELRHPSLRVQVQVSCDEFAGRRSVWISATALSVFCEALAQLWKSGLGECELGSMSPNEFQLKLETLGRPFRVVASASVRKEIAPLGVRRDLGADVSFPIEFATLEQILAGFLAVLATLRPAR